MPASRDKIASTKFPLRLMPYVRKGAEKFSRREGVSLNQFINVAVAEKLAHLQHDEWIASRSKPSSERIARALAILDRPTRDAEAGDDLPKDYNSIRNSPEYRRIVRKK